MSSESTTAHAHQFVDARQQRDAVGMGMWIFLIGEVMFFGGLFTGYGVYRLRYPQVFAEAAHHLDIVLGTINTVVLITSSLTMALAVQGAQVADRRNVMRFLAVTIILGCVFLGIKGFEYAHKAHEHLLPGTSFQYHSAAHAGPARIFFSFYFVMTGVHAAHLVIGIIVMLILAVMSGRQRAAMSSNSIEAVGLYWHLVDIIWIFLFPMLYLIGRHG